MAECLAAIRRRRADVDDLLGLVWHHAPIILGGSPHLSVDEFLGRIRARE